MATLHGASAAPGGRGCSGVSTSVTPFGSRSRIEMVPDFTHPPLLTLKMYLIVSLGLGTCGTLSSIPLGASTCGSLLDISMAPLQTQLESNVILATALDSLRSMRPRGIWGGKICACSAVTVHFAEFELMLQSSSFCSFNVSNGNCEARMNVFFPSAPGIGITFPATTRASTRLDAENSGETVPSVSLLQRAVTVAPEVTASSRFAPPGAIPISTDAVASAASLFTNTSLLRLLGRGVGPGVENNVGQPLGVEQPRVVEGFILPV